MQNCTQSLKIVDLKKICEILLNKFCENVGSEIVIDQDYYWRVHEDYKSYPQVTWTTGIPALIDDIPTFWQMWKEDFMTTVEIERVSGIFKFLGSKIKYVEEHGLPLKLDELFLAAMKDAKPSFKYIVVLIHEFNEICDSLINKIERAEGEEVSFEYDSYVKVPEDEIYVFSQKPNLIEQSLYDDLKQFKKIFKKGTVSSKDFIRFSDILFALAAEIRRGPNIVV